MLPEQYRWAPSAAHVSLFHCFIVSLILCLFMGWAPSAAHEIEVAVVVVVVVVVVVLVAIEEVVVMVLV